MKLTAKQEAFARAYVACGVATQAAKKAGYSEKTAAEAGSENLRKPHIWEFIESLRKPIVEELGITAEWIRERLKIEATLDKRGGGTQAGRVRALELLGKDAGMFSDNRSDEEKLPILEVVVTDATQTDGTTDEDDQTAEAV